jgi:MFS family permease
VFTAFAVSLVAARVLLGHVPDQLGGAKVALVCVLVEAAGLALIWLATDRTTAAAGAALAGFGYALVYPGLGIEAVRRAPSQSRGLAMGAYTVFLDVALGFGSPMLGLIAGRFGLDTVFLASALIALGAATISTRILLQAVLKGESNASRHRKALARQIRKAKSSARRGNNQGSDDRSQLWRRVSLGCDGRSRSRRLDGQGLQAGHPRQAEANLQETRIQFRLNAINGR